MNFIQIVDVILTVCVLAIGAYSAYCAAGKTVYKKVSYLISEAAKLDIIGSEKMSRVVDELYKSVPPMFKKILTKERLETAAQSIYDNMKAFVKNDAE